MKLAIVSHVLPPTWSGQAMILERLLRTFDPATYVLIRTMETREEGDHGPSLPARVFELPLDPVSLSGRVLLRRLRLGRSIHALLARTRRIAEIVQAERCDAIVGCTGGDLLDIPASYAAARRAGAQFFLYYFDYWSQQSPGGSRQRRIAEWIEPLFLRRAEAVIVPNEFLADELEVRHGVSCTIVRNACDISASDNPESNNSSDRGPAAPASILYTGAVYEANLDAFRNLITAIVLTSLDVTIKIFTAQSARALAAAGITGPVEVHQHRSADDVRALQRSANVLFLPLAFTSSYPRLIRSSSPAKMCEYLASGRPVLVHAPPNSFVAEYFRKHRCGVVVDEPDPMLLAGALRQLLHDNELRARVTNAAWARARADYDLNAARAKLAATLGLCPPRTKPHLGQRRMKETLE